MVSKLTARKITLYRQGLQKRPASPTQESLKKIIRQMGLLQLDSISVTARSHYLVMLSRAGLYDVADLDSLLDEKFLFEQWAHAACMIPMEDFPYFEPRIHAKREIEGRRLARIGENAQDVLDHILSEIREKGALSSKDFESPREGAGSWWNWKPAKIGLEYLFDRGYLMTATRKNFRRYYNLAERVLDGIPMELGKSADDFHEWAAITGLKNIGIGTIADIADYYREKKTLTKSYCEKFVESGAFIPVDVEGTLAYIHQDDFHLIEKAESGELDSQVTTFLSPFDNLIWFRERAEWLFDFYYRVEMYTPAAKRKYGYYVLPILHEEKLVGRIDPKVDRKSKQFIIRALHLEPSTAVNDSLIQALVSTIREFMTFHDCTTFALESCEDESLKQAIEDAV